MTHYLRWGRVSHQRSYTDAKGVATDILRPVARFWRNIGSHGSDAKQRAKHSIHKVISHGSMFDC